MFESEIINDLVYYASILVCVSLSTYYKNITDVELKRNYGVGLGVLAACVVCGHHIYHTILMVWGNVIILKCCNKSYIHQISLAYTWSYLMVLHVYVTSAYVIWIHQIMALRLVGLAFEVNSMLNNTSKQSAPAAGTAEDSDNVEPSAADIIAYSYFFIGLHRGPYYRWKIFHDHFTSSFSVLGGCWDITEQKLKKALICVIGIAILRAKFPVQVYSDDAFYTECGSDYRYMYNVPQLVAYYLKYRMTMLMCTSVFTEAGFGVYPAQCESLPGFGPSARYSLLKIAVTNCETAMEQEYNFGMLKCFDNRKLILGPKMKDTVRGWNMPTRYWFWSYPYKNLIKGNKEVRSACAFVAWLVWSGSSLQQLIISATLWVYIHLEAEYSVLYNTTGPMKPAWDIGFSMMRLFCLIYLAPCFTIAEAGTVLRYYNSILWMFHLLLIVLLVGAVVAYKSNT